MKVYTLATFPSNRIMATCFHLQLSLLSCEVFSVGWCLVHLVHLCKLSVNAVLSSQVFDSLSNSCVPDSGMY